MVAQCQVKPKAGKQPAIDNLCNLRELLGTAEKQLSDLAHRTACRKPLDILGTIKNFATTRLFPGFADAHRAGRRQAWRVGSEKREIHNLRRGWAGSSASLNCPARWFVEFHNARLDKCPLRAHSARIPPSAVSGSPAPCGWAGRPSSCQATLRWPPARCAARLVFLWRAEPWEEGLLVPIRRTCGWHRE